MKEDGRSVQGHGISPSNEGGKGYFFTKPPPLNPREGPTQEEIERSMTIKGPLGEKGAVSIPVATGIIGLVLGAGGVLLYQEVFAAEKSENIDSFPNSFNPEQQLVGLPPHLQNPTFFNQERTNPVNPAEVSSNSENNNPQSIQEPEIKKVNPVEVFDNTLTKGTFTERNSVAMTPEQYQETSPQVIKGDSVVIPLPIEFPEGQIPTVKFKKEKGKMFGGRRFINGRLENGEIVSDGTVPVDDLIILRGIPIGSVLLSPWDGEIEFYTSSGYEDPTDGNLKTAAFTIYTTDAKGNKVILYISTVTVKPLIKPSHSEYEEGTNHTKPFTKKPLGLRDSIVEILTTKDHSNFDGQIRITASSQVVEENGQKRGGPAGIEIATTPEGQAIRLDRNSDSK